MFTRKDFLTGGVALAACGRLSSAEADALRRVPPTEKAALTTPEVKFKDLQTVKMLTGGGRDAMKKLGARIKRSAGCRISASRRTTCC